MTRSLLLAAGLVALPSLAARPRPAPEAPAAAPACPPSDASFTRALVWAFEPAPLEVRVRAIEDLGLLGDPRALNPLAQFAVDANGLWARAALRAIATIQHPRAEEILVNAVHHPSVHENNKLFAIAMLPFQRTWSSVRVVRAMASNAALSPALRQAAQALAGTLPDPAAAAAPPGDEK